MSPIFTITQVCRFCRSLLVLFFALNTFFVSASPRATIDSLAHAESLHILAKSLLGQNDYFKAEKILYASQKLFKNYGDEENIACINFSLAQLKIQRNEFDSAFRYLMYCKPVFAKHGRTSELAEAIMLNGYIYLRKNELLKAGVNLERAYQINTTLRNQKNLATNSVYLAELYFNTDELEKAELFAERSLRLGQKFKKLPVIRDASKLLYQMYSLKEDFEKAFSMLHLHKVYNDSLFSKETLREQAKLELQNQFERQREKEQLTQQRKIFEREQELQSQRYVSGFATIGFLVFIVIAFLIYRSLRISTRANDSLQEQNIIISQKNTQIEEQATHLQQANESIEMKNQKITDSIEYAKRIQDAIHPIPYRLQRHFPDMFVIQRPKDILSGDFYWVGDRQDNVVIAVADCTGHGVPGALMSMLGTSLLNEILRVGIWNTNEILEELRLQVKESLHQRGIQNEQKDGMDMALCAIDTVDYTLQYSGANNPVYLYREEELMELKPVRNPIGIYVKERSFETQEVKLKKNDMIYMFSDGFPDQLNERGNKYLHKRLKDLFTEIHEKPVKEQEQILVKVFNDWKGNNDQTDDIIVLGFRVN